jgi:curved DNA-binding protein CbpA
VGASNPFLVLGLSARPDLSDDDVRAAWRRIAAATHPDRPDGGDPARYAAAADAYSRLRGGWDRGEAYADLTGGPAASRRPRGGLGRRREPGLRARPGALAVRLACAAAAGYGAYAAIGWAPATPAVITGAITWLILTGRRDLTARAG